MNPKQIGIGILVVAIIAVAVMQFGSMNKNANTEDTQTAVTQPVTQALMQEEQVASNDAMMEAATYKDGEYSATGEYKSPAQVETVDITLTLEDGIVTAAEFTGNATNQVSQKLQGLFADGYEEEVVGKSIDEIKLTVVNGSSLTPKGFMDALEQVKEEAKS